MIKKVFIIALLVVFVFVTLAGCGTSGENSKEENTSKVEAKGNKSGTKDSETKKRLKFGCTVQDLANPYFVVLVDGMKKKCEEIGADITVVDGKSDAATQVSAVENFIAQKVDAIIIAPIDPIAMEPLVEKAHEAGIPVINPTQRIKGVDANINLIDREYGFEGGKIAGQWIKDKLGGEAEVAILGHPVMEALVERAKGIKEGILSVAPNAKIVAEQTANTPETGMKAAETILQAHPNVKVIAAINDAGALGAMEAVKAAGKATEDFCIVGLDATPEAIEKIKEGSIFRGTVDIDPFGTGKQTIDVCLKVIEEGPIKEMVKIKMIPVTEENVDQY